MLVLLIALFCIYYGFLFSQIPKLFPHCLSWLWRPYPLVIQGEKARDRLDDMRIYLFFVTPYRRGLSENPSTGYGQCYAPSFNNGNLVGITEALPYVKAMGYNMIWITPVMDSNAGQPNASGTVDLKLDSTGYFYQNPWQIDPLFGTLREYQTLVSHAHSLGLYVLFDIALGHSKQNLPPSPSGLTVPNILDFTVPSTVAYFTELLVFWIQMTEIDGFRFDQIYQVPLEALHYIIDTVQATFQYRKARGFEWGIKGFLVGEVLCTGNLTYSNGLGSCTTDSGVSLANLEKNILYMLQSVPVVFNFPLFFLVRQCLSFVDFQNQPLPFTKETSEIIVQGFSWSEAHQIPSSRLCLLFNNHDMPRFGNLLLRSGIVKNTSDPDYWKRHKLFFSFLASYSGPIQSFYLDEVAELTPGFVQALTLDQRCLDLNLCDDESGRVSGRIDGYTDSEKNLQQFIRSLWHLRQQYTQLSNGKQSILQANQVWISQKSDPNSSSGSNILFVMNISQEAQWIYSQRWGNKPLHFLLGTEHFNMIRRQYLTYFSSPFKLLISPLSASFFLFAS